ncbi:MULTISPECIES: hypothetical protein [Alkalihalophilus]|uniref:Lipoprotein n=1 Tax=Alkalihalophilus pseudofirmus TaxID=79885 RepID=A0AAJ2NKK4_ALKPS|nr:MULTISPECIES: hypothetical protein [Alkalihalophilus]MDV2884419.1 hypothetical protein [Alkalihalophilus pseudofirmus]MEC2070907.1 hypothetical protein [Alkalihalophilus marmarensis]
MKKQMFLILAGMSILFAGCMQDNSADLMEDIKQSQTEGTFGAQRFSNNTDQNHAIRRADTELLTYAKEAGVYLEQTINQLEDLAPTFQEDSFQADSLHSVLSTIHSIKQNSERFHNIRIPHEFEGFHQIHIGFITELTDLERVIDDMREPVDPRQALNARVHYENIMISHKSMEREFMSLSEDYGFH